ncbi:hypothetical protein AOLI_G00247800 [Acnodon oligacanthus]
MQVSFVCTDHRSMSRSTDDRLNRQNANSPNTGTRSKFRAVAMVARSLGQLSVQSVPSSSDQSMRTGMKYRSWNALSPLRDMFKDPSGIRKPPYRLQGWHVNFCHWLGSCWTCTSMAQS